MISIDKKKWRLIFNAGYPVPIGKEDLEKFFLFVWKKGISYYTVCPFDVDTSIKILAAAITEGGDRIGPIAANLLVEFVLAYYLFRTFKTDTYWFYTTLARNISYRAASKDPTSAIYLLVLERLLGISLLSDQIRSKLDSKLLELSQKIYSVLERGGILTRDTWFEKAKRIAELLKESMKNNKKISEKNLGSELQKEMLTSPVSSDIFFAIIKYSTSPIEHEQIMEKIISSVIKFSGSNILRASAAILSLKILKSPKDLLRYWYRDRAKGRVKIELSFKREKKTEIITYPETWSIGDPIESLDTILSLSSFPIMIPNLTTKKWVIHKVKIGERMGQPPDLLVIIDSSGSMRYYTGWKEPIVDKKSPEYKLMKKLGLKYPVNSKYDLALVGAFAAIEYALARNSKIAAINFSGKGISCNWTLNRKKIEQTLLNFQGDGTELPCKEIRKIIKSTESSILVILITDAEIYNKEEAQKCLREIIEKGHILYIFHIEEKGYYPILETVEKWGGKVIRIRNLEELTDIVIKEVSPFYAIF